jgi:ketosteroid isomerase-like protein
MGMRSGKVLKAARKTVARAKPKPARARKAAPPKKKAAAPKVITKTVTKTVEVDRNRALRDLAQRIVDVTVANDDNASLAFYADTIESREANNPPSTGIDAIKQKFAMWRGMVTDAAFTPRSVAADGNTIVIEWEGRVTLAASGRVVDFLEVAVHEIRDGKIVKERFYYDPSVLQG